MRFSEGHNSDCISSLTELAINDMVSWRYKELTISQDKRKPTYQNLKDQLNSTSIVDSCCQIVFCVSLIFLFVFVKEKEKRNFSSSFDKYVISIVIFVVSVNSRNNAKSRCNRFHAMFCK